MKRAIPIASALLLAFHAAQAQAQGAGKETSKLPGLLPEGIHVEPKYFQPTAANSEGGIGFAYTINEKISTTADKKAPLEAFSTLNLDFQARGTVALNKNTNPADFLKTGLDLNYQHSRVSIGELEPGPGCDLMNPDTVEQCRNLAMRGLRLDLGLIASLESDQKFDKQAKAYGGQITVAYLPARNSMANQLNPLDWPFRLLRSASGHPMGSMASPNAFPTVRLALERIKPDKDPDREAVLGKKEDYDRVNVELAMSTPAGMLPQTKQQLKFEWSWRYFKELSPDDAIRAAKLDRFRYSATSVKLDAGWRVTYATGRLPLDRQSDKVWEIGYEVKLN